MKRPPVCIVRTDTRRQCVALLDPAGNAGIGQLDFFAMLSVSISDCESALSFIDFGVTEKFY